MPDRANQTSWLRAFARETASTNVLPDDAQRPGLLAAGLMGEAGSVLAEIKKAARDGAAYPFHRRRVVEELGDLLWYYVRLADVFGVDVDTLDVVTERGGPAAAPLPSALRLGAAAGALAAHVATGRCDDRAAATRLLDQIGRAIGEFTATLDLELESAALANARKALGRWPRERVYRPLFDDGLAEEEQLPRRLSVEFRERDGRQGPHVLLRCNDLNVGDRISDNAHQLDGYRFHDVFHLAHAVHLGWSPVLRALLRCKRKSDSRLDEVEDGARAMATEEALTAIIHCRAKELRFFADLERVDFDLLKTIQAFTPGLEVAALPSWQWEAAILDGYRAFRSLRAGRGGTVEIDLVEHRLTVTEPNTEESKP